MGKGKQNDMKNKTEGKMHLVGPQPNYTPKTKTINSDSCQPVHSHGLVLKILHSISVKKRLCVGFT